MGNAKTKVRDLLAVLSRPGALAILELAGNGLRINPRSHLPAGITRRQMRTRIRELSKSGLIEKKNGTYCMTSFGKLCQKHIPRLERAFLLGRNHDE